MNLFSATAMAALFISATATAAPEGKKLLVFVLAGQSNMQGHAEVSTLAYAPKPAYVPTYRYDGSGRFFLRLGDECADAMFKLMGRK